MRNFFEQIRDLTSTHICWKCWQYWVLRYSCLGTGVFFTI